LAAWCGRLGKWFGIQTRAQFAAGAVARPAISLRAWPRLLAHTCLLLLLFVLFLGGGFRGALAQPVQSNQVGGDLDWQWYWPADSSAGAQSAYASIPAMPLMVQHLRPSLEESFPAAEAEQPAVVAQRTEVLTYTVQSGDTLISIAVQYGVHVETIYWLNSLKSADLLLLDQKLLIPPVDGLVYEVKAGDTLDSIAEDFKVRKGNMIAYAANNLREPYDLVEGQQLFVPGASKPIPRPPVAPAAPSGRPFRLSAPAYASLPGGERFSWPTSGHISDRFGWTGQRWHNALDIATAWGTPIYAAAAGTVSRAGWESGYGNMVELNHGDGWSTRYGHMAQQPEVSVGQWVERGQLIGFIGCTGNCTGPHVHFEIRYNGANCNPLDYLP
jgi:murein DD-endopeptidase MepM/ murein hydrolase activator NlpD